MGDHALYAAINPLTPRRNNDNAAFTPRSNTWPHTTSDRHTAGLWAETTVGAPVTVHGPDGIRWNLNTTPPTSATTFHDPVDQTTTFRPDVPGHYTVGTADTNHEKIHIQASDRSDLIDQYAPILHFHTDTQYRPTRIEAMLAHAELRRTDDPATYSPIPGGDYPRNQLAYDPHGGETVVDQPTVFDLAGRDRSHYLYLPENREAYQRYHEAYPPTVYTTVTDTTFRDEPYTAVVYWFFLVFDPKHGVATFFEHQADLESIIVLVGEDGPEWFAAAQHGSGEFRRWATTPLDTTHPHIYLEKGAHASMLRDSSRYDGDGFLVQGYYLGNDSPFSSGSETDPVVSLVHTDETGSDVVWRPDERDDRAYQLRSSSRQCVVNVCGRVFGRPR